MYAAQFSKSVSSIAHILTYNLLNLKSLIFSIILRVSTITYTYRVTGQRLSLEYGYGFNDFKIKGSLVGLVNKSALLSMPIESSQCSASRYVNYFSYLSFWDCFDRSKPSMCLPPSPFGQWAAAKGTSSSRSLVFVSQSSSLCGTRCHRLGRHYRFVCIHPLLSSLVFRSALIAPHSFIQNKLSGCAVCGVFWLSM